MALAGQIGFVLPKWTSLRQIGFVFAKMAPSLSGTQFLHRGFKERMRNSG